MIKNRLTMIRRPKFVRKKLTVARRRTKRRVQLELVKVKVLTPAQAVTET